MVNTIPEAVPAFSFETYCNALLIEGVLAKTMVVPNIKNKNPSSIKLALDVKKPSRINTQNIRQNPSCKVLRFPKIVMIFALNREHKAKASEKNAIQIPVLKALRCNCCCR